MNTPKSLLQKRIEVRYQFRLEETLPSFISPTAQNIQILLNPLSVASARWLENIPANVSSGQQGALFPNLNAMDKTRLMPARAKSRACYAVAELASKPMSFQSPFRKLPVAAHSALLLHLIMQMPGNAYWHGGINVTKATPVTGNKPPFVVKNLLILS